VGRNKVVSARAAVELIRAGDTLATGGFVGVGFAEEVAIALEERFFDANAATAGGPGALGTPDASSAHLDLTLVYAAGQGDGKTKGLNHLAHEGLIRRVIGGHWGLGPGLQKLPIDGRIQAYSLPQAPVSHLFRDIAAHKPGLLSTICLGIFVDRRHGRGKRTART